MSKRVLIVGGGAAGWLAALYCKKIDPSLNVELIESEEIGIIGAGESTTSFFKAALNFLNIDIREFVRETESTIKSSIRFDDWDFPGSSYLSIFTPWFSDQIIKIQEIADYFLYCSANNIDLNQIGIHKFNLENKAPVTQIDDMMGNETYDVTQGFTYHINAKLTAKFFRKIAESRGIVRHEGKIIKINGHYPIQSLEDNKGRTHKVDFVFDCSGFARLIIGKHFNTEWIDYGKYLTVNSTIPFFLPVDKEIPPYTRATAMKYGWMFKVPTQKRYGSGYVYNSNLISKEQAIQEVQEKLGHDVQLVNHFNFNGGTYKDTFVSNCIGLGLASNFLEPMAGTNLGLVLLALKKIAKQIENTSSETVFSPTPSDDFRNYLNQVIVFEIEHSAICEIFSHYVNNRNDTEFWNHYKNIENYPPVFRKAYEECFLGDKFEYKQFSHMTRFVDHTFVTKMIGNNWCKEKIIKYCNDYNLNKTYDKLHADIVSYAESIKPYILDHRDYLERVCTYD